MNLGLTNELALAFPNILSIEKPIIKDLNIKNPNWVSGFTSGDGCFYIKVFFH